MTIDKHEVKLSSSEKASAKREKHKLNLIKSNPELSAANKASADAKRERRKASGSTKKFS